MRGQQESFRYLIKQKKIKLDDKIREILPILIEKVTKCSRRDLVKEHKYCKKIKEKPQKRIL